MPNGLLEKKFGLPPFKEISNLLTDEKLRQINVFLTKVQALSKEFEKLAEAKDILVLIKQLDDQGALERLNTLLQELSPIVKGKALEKLISKLDSVEKLIDVLTKEE